jgi:signal transduction histidine kinase
MPPDPLAMPALIDRTHIRIVFWLAIVTAVGTMADWGIGELGGVNTRWDTWGVPVVSLAALGAAITIHLRPQHLQRAVLSALLPGSVFCLGGLHLAAQSTDIVSWQSLAATAQFVPLFYISAFVALQRGAARLSWAHYLGMVALYIVNFGWPSASPSAGPANTAQHIWLAVLTSNPAYILSLQYISTLRGRLARSERDHHDSKERFLAMLSHEIRTPLQAMLGSIDLLALKAKSPPERRAVDRLRESATQLEAHLRDVTEFTRLENPAWQLQAEDVDLLALARDVCEQYRPQAEARGLDLQLQIDDTPVPELAPPPPWALTRTDGRRLRQVLANLLSNALKYTPQGQILLRLNAPGPHQAMSMAVVDTGIGIPADHLDRIFDPYVRLEDRRVGQEEGSGLGLAVVRLLSQRLGLQLEVDSAPECGSTFRLVWPLPHA